MARLPDLLGFSRKHNLKICTIEDLIKYRRQRERLIQRELTLKLPTRFGDFDLIAYTSVVDPEPHLALCMGGIGVEVGGVVPVHDEPVLVRIHSQCLTGDIFESKLCDCGSQLHQAMKQVAEAGKGVILYMRRRDAASACCPSCKRTSSSRRKGWIPWRRISVSASAPTYGITASAPQILLDLGIRQIRLLTNNPKKVVGVDGYGLHIVERVPIQIAPNQSNRRYLQTKKDKLGHLLDEIDESI